MRIADTGKQAPPAGARGLAQPVSAATTNHDAILILMLIICQRARFSLTCVTGGRTLEPKTCADLAYDCGEANDGCGNTMACGSCTAPATCGACSPGRCGVATFAQ
jgi:hypothetical protein